MEKAVKILVVDDDRTALALVDIALGGEPGYRLFQATDTKEGMRIAEQERPSLIISDRQMPNEDGLGFCKRVRNHPMLSDTMFILLTASSESAHKVSGLDAGADDYLTKPIDPEVLASKVKALLRIKSLQDELRSETAELERLNQALNSSLDGVVALLMNIVGLRVPNANGRALWACNFARWIGVRVGMDATELGSLDLAARLHEIGKIVMPDDLLKKPRKELGQEELETLKHFPVFGQMLVGSIRELKGIEKVLRHQLENYDGSGLPDRLMREEIPIGSRILRVVNHLTELESGQPLDADLKIAALHAVKGTMLDPRILQLAEEYLRVVSQPSWLAGKREIPLSELKEGMKIAADITTGSGMKLLPKDLRLTQLQIDRILSHHRTDPIITNVYIYEAS